MKVPVVDLRSDTVTRPTPGMRQAIAEAEVGDDVLGDDPTTKRLEARVAELLGKEAALFFPSGVMANQAALAVLGSPGAEVLLDEAAHIFHYEEGAAAALSGLQLRPVPSSRGVMAAVDVEARVRAASPYQPRTRVICLENTHLESGGRIQPPEAVAAVAGVAARHGLAVHLDGARLWHACVELGLPPDAWARYADTVMVSLSKGLGAPVGSVLAGERGVMAEAWRVRRRLGGGMRQTGILAAAALWALEHNLDRLVEDHARGKALARALGAVPGLVAEPPETNIVLARTTPGGPDLGDLLSFLEKHRILMLKFGADRVRAVTHLDVDDRGVDRVFRVLADWSSGRQTFP